MLWYAHTIVDAKERKDKKKATGMDIASLAVESGACLALENFLGVDIGAESCAEPKEKKRKKEKKHRKAADSDPTATTESRKGKKDKRKRDKASSSDAAPLPTSPKRSRVTISPAEAAAYLKAHNITVHLPPSDASPLLPEVSFDALPIPDRLRGAFSAFKEPTPIQACAWPPALSGKDVVGIAETGSGKTLAFGIPALARLLSSSGAGNGPRALVLAPTRELALQTYDALSALDAVRCVAVFGGVDKAQQVRAIKGAQVVIGTPGRILDLIGDGALALGGVEYLVLDEADRMLDKGFENDIRRIIGYAKQGAARQTLMCASFSAFSSLLGIDVKCADGSQRYLARGGASVGGLVLARSSTDHRRK